MIDQIEQFIAEGNTVSGPLPTTKGATKLLWSGQGNHLSFGDDVTLVGVRINFLGPTGTILIGANTQVKGDLVVNKGSTIEIGDNTFINRVCDIRAQEGADIHIGKGCLFSNVGIFTSDLHSIVDMETKERSNPAQSIVIEDNVWLSENVKIAKGARVGAGAIIAAGSIVSHPIAPYCIGAGRPAKVVRAGVSWDRRLFKAKHKPARPFQGSDIPLNREVLRKLVADKRYSLTLSAIEAVIAKGTEAIELPHFAQWYLVFCRSRLKKNQPDDKAILEGFIKELPNHKAAQKLYDEHFS